MIFSKRLKLSKELLLIAYPVSLSQLSHVITNISDSVMLGKYDAVHLAASTFAFNVFIPILIFCIGFSMGITPFVSQADAEGNENQLKEVANNSVFLFGGLSLVVFMLSMPLVFFMDGMNQSERIVPLAQNYYVYLCLSMIPVVGSFVFKQFSEGLGLTKPSMVINVACNGINIVLNYILIFGKCGFSPMGIEGAGIATLISRCCIFLFSWLYIYKKPLFKKYLWRNPFAGVSVKQLLVITKVSIPVAVQFTMEVSAFAVSAIMIGWLGETALASHQIAISIAAVTYLIASGLGAGATVKVGNAIGKKDVLLLRNMATTSFMIVLAFMSCSAVLIFLFKDQIPYLYVQATDVEVIQKATMLLVFAAIFQLSDGVQVVAHGILRGMKDVRIPTLYSFIAYWLLGLPSGYVLGIELGYGVKGFWIGLTISLLSLSLMLTWRVFQQIKKSTNKLC